MDFTQHRCDIAYRNVRSHERESCQVPQKVKIAADLDKSTIIQALVQKAGAIDPIRAKIIYLAKVLEDSPFQIKAYSTHLTKRAVNDANATDELCGPAGQSYTRLKGQMRILQSSLIGLGRSSLFGKSNAYQYCSTQLWHDLNEVKTLHRNGLMAYHAHEDSRRLLYEVSSQKVWTPLRLLNAIARDLFSSETNIVLPTGDKAYRLARERAHSCRERHRNLRLDLIDLQGSFEDVLCVTSARIEKIPDSRPPKLVD